jgi:hypothetical protein
MAGKNIKNEHGNDSLQNLKPIVLLKPRLDKGKSLSKAL